MGERSTGTAGGAVPRERKRVKGKDRGTISKSNMLVIGTNDFGDYLLLLISFF